MNREEAFQEFSKKLLAQNIFGDEQVRAEAEKVVDAIPPAHRGEYSEDVIIAANEFYATYQSISGETTDVTATSGASTAVATSNAYVPPVLTDALADSLEQALTSYSGDKRKATANTQIVKLLRKNPPITKLLKKATVVPVIKDEAKLKEYEENLLDTPENKAAFERVKAAVINKTELPIYVNDNTFKIVGVQIKTPSTKEGAGAFDDLTLSLNQLVGFLATKVYNRIPSEKTGVGCQIRGIKAKNNGRAGMGGTAQAAQVTPSFVGVKEAKEKADMVVAINEPVKKGSTIEMVAGKLPIKETFQVIRTDKGLKADGSPYLRTVRLRGDGDKPVFKRIEDYVEIFGMEKVSGVISAVLSPEEIADNEALTKSILATAITGGFGSPKAFGADLMSIVNKAKSGAAATKDVAGEFE